VTTAEKLFEIRFDDDAVIATPTSDLRELEYQRIGREAEEILALLSHDDQAPRHVVIDLRRSDVFGSSALGLFVNLWNQVRQRGGRMAFCNVSPHELSVLEATKLDKVWPIVPKLEDALRAVRAAPEAT
jgi:anti-anti-sigma factor